MITNQIAPAHILRLYAWAVLQETGALALVNGKNPIIPLEDEPDLSDAGANYIIYGYSESDINGINYMSQGVMAFRIVALNSNDLSKISNILFRTFRDEDIATEAVNIFSGRFPGDALQGIRFTSVKSVYIESADPAVSESGPVEGIVTVNFRYVNHLSQPVPHSVSQIGGLWV